MSCGRKHCTSCGCWRHAHDFGRNPNNRTGLQSHCRTCQRVSNRHRLGVRRRGKAFEAQERRATAGIPRLSDGSINFDSPQYREYQRSRYRVLTPEQRAERREYQRIWHSGRRRAAGVPERIPIRRAPVEGPVKSYPAGPFAAWVRGAMDDEESSKFALSHGVSAKLLRDILSGRRATVSLDSIDKILTAHGEPWMLEELYPLEVAA